MDIGQPFVDSTGTGFGFAFTPDGEQVLLTIGPTTQIYDATDGTPVGEPMTIGELRPISGSRPDRSPTRGGNPDDGVAVGYLSAWLERRWPTLSHPDPRRWHRARAGGGDAPRPRCDRHRLRVGGRRRRRGNDCRTGHAAHGGASVDPAQQGRHQGAHHHARGEGFRSVNVTLRQALGLYANLRPARSMQGVVGRFDGIDLVIVRENTEDLYAGIEHRVGQDAAESIKIITREASADGASRSTTPSPTAGARSWRCKAGYHELSDGLFLESCRTVAADYVGRIEFEDRIVDNGMRCSSSRSPGCTTCWCSRTCMGTS